MISGEKPARIALAWLLCKLGARKMHHLEEAVAALEIKLSPEEMAALKNSTVLPSIRVIKTALVGAHGGAPSSRKASTLDIQNHTGRSFHILRFFLPAGGSTAVDNS